MLCELANGEALVTQLERSLEVEVVSWTTKRFALLSCALKACACSGYELLSLLLSDPAEDRYEQLAHGTLGIEPRFTKAHHAHTELIEGEHRLHVARHRASEPIERPDEQDIEGASVRVA